MSRLESFRPAKTSPEVQEADSTVSLAALLQELTARVEPLFDGSSWDSPLKTEKGTSLWVGVDYSSRNCYLEKEVIFDLPDFGLVFKVIKLLNEKSKINWLIHSLGENESLPSLLVGENKGRPVILRTKYRRIEEEPISASEIEKLKTEGFNHRLLVVDDEVAQKIAGFYQRNLPEAILLPVGLGGVRLIVKEENGNTFTYESKRSTKRMSPKEQLEACFKETGFLIYAFTSSMERVVYVSS